MELGDRELVMKFHRSYALNIVNYMRQKKMTTAKELRF